MPTVVPCLVEVPFPYRTMVIVFDALTSGTQTIGALSVADYVSVGHFAYWLRVEALLEVILQKAQEVVDASNATSFLRLCDITHRPPNHPLRTRLEACLRPSREEHPLAKL